MPVIYIFLLLTGLLFYILYKGVFSFYFFAFLVIFPILLFGLYFYVSRKLKISIIKSDGVKIKGEKIPLNLQIVNPTHIPVSNMTITLEISDNIKNKKDIFRINTPVYPKETQCLGVELTPSHCGKVSCKIVKCRLTDLLKLFVFKVKDVYGKRENHSWDFSVIPSYTSLQTDVVSDFNSGNPTEEYSKNNKGDDPSEIFDIHEYNAGDKINKIHWKLSAKQDLTMVKEYSLPMTNSILLIFNPELEIREDNTNDMSFRYDAALEGILTAANCLTEKKAAFTCVWFTQGKIQSMTVQDKEEFDTLCRQLCLSDIKNKNKNIFQLDEYGFTKYQYSHLLYFSGRYDEITLKYLFNSEIALKYSCMLSDPRVYNTVTDEYAQVFRIAPGQVSAVFDNIQL